MLLHNKSGFIVYQLLYMKKKAAHRSNGRLFSG